MLRVVRAGQQHCEGQENMKKTLSIPIYILTPMDSIVKYAKTFFIKKRLTFSSGLLTSVDTDGNFGEEVTCNLPL